MNILNRLFGRKNLLSCEQVAMVMQQYLDSELAADEVPKVLAHLEMCKDCGLEAELYTKIKDALVLHRVTPSEASMSGVRALAEQLSTTGPPVE